MTTNAKTFRLFISSTFNDFKLERQVLHEKVFPVIDNYCIEKGYTFQPVDLRWGVNDEAQLDQKTLDLCLNEVKACKHYPYPNFLIMLGNRYGWVSLPYAIEKNEFEAILTFHADNNEAISMLEEWYIEDSNHLVEDSHAYVIKERDPEGAYAEPEAWEHVENELRTLLQDAANALFKETAQYRKYFLSATEAEVEEGIFKYLRPTQFQTSLYKEEEFNEKSEIDKDYVYGFVRTIEDPKKYDLKKEPAKWFIDEDQTNVSTFRQELTDTLKESNIHRHRETVTLTENKDEPVADKSYLVDFEAFMIEKLKDAVDTQIKKAQKISELDQERSEQLRFKSLKTETFFGRKKELDQVQAYITKTTTQPFIVHGISGIGKSSFIATAIDQTEELMTHRVAYRFIGATASTSNIRTLLESLISDLADQGVLELPKVFEEDSNKFNDQIKALLSGITQSTVIILDALDQLQHKDNLQWLPLELPSNLKIILSMLDQKGYEHYYDWLKNKIDANHQLEITPIEEDVATEILDALLDKEKRALTDTQKAYVLKQFQASQSSPLYLKIAFEEVKTWRSNTTETLSVGIQEIIKEFIDNLTVKFHHPKVIVHRVLGFISAFHNGLSEKEIHELLSQDEDFLKSLEKYHELTLFIEDKQVKLLPISNLVRFIDHFKPFLNARLINEQNNINIFHRYMNEVISEYCLVNENLFDFLEKIISKKQYNLFCTKRWAQLYKEIISAYYDNNFDINSTWHYYSFENQIKIDRYKFISTLKNTFWINSYFETYVSSSINNIIIVGNREWHEYQLHDIRVHFYIAYHLKKSDSSWNDIFNNMYSTFMNRLDTDYLLTPGYQIQLSAEGYGISKALFLEEHNVYTQSYIRSFKSLVKQVYDYGELGALDYYANKLRTDINNIKVLNYLSDNDIENLSDEIDRLN